MSKAVLMYNIKPIGLMMANTIQTILCAAALSKKCKVTILLNGDLGDPQKCIKKITSDIDNLKIRYVSSRLSLYFRLIIEAINSQHKVLYTRSLLTALLWVTLNDIAVVELHQDRFTKSRILHQLLLQLLKFFELKNIKLVVISEALQARYLKGKIKNNLTVIHDGYDEILIGKQRWTRVKRAVYTGTVSVDRGLLEIMQLAASFPDIRFVIIGSSRAELPAQRDMVKAAQSRNIRIYGKQSRFRVRLFQAHADVLLAFWGTTVPTMEYCSPLKIFEYMSVGRRILCHNFPSVRCVIPPSPIVEFVPPGSELAVCQGMRRLLATSLTCEDSDALRAAAKPYSYSSRAERLRALWI
jgi:glycosyltransferase involved in cell wall biosynthesis